MRRELLFGMGAIAFWIVTICSFPTENGIQQCVRTSSGLTVWPFTSALSDQSSPVTYGDIAPILRRRCTLCHSGPTASANLSLDSYPNLQMRGRNGPVVVPGNAERSEIVRRVRGLSQPRMPMNGPPWLAESEVAQVERWISDGAPDTLRAKSEQQSAASSTATTTRDSEKVTFTHVAPIFNARCVKCHAPKGLMGSPPEDIRLDSYQAVVSYSERAIIIPGFPGSSLLVRAIKGDEKPQMPMDGPPYLDPAEIDLIAMWVQQGARDPAGNPTRIPAGARIRLTGTLTANWELDGIPFRVGSKTHIRKNPALGTRVEVRGHVTPEGRIEAREIRPR